MRRIVAIAGALVLTLAIAVVAVAAGGPLSGLAAGLGDGRGARGPAQGGAVGEGPSEIPTALFELAVGGAPGAGVDRQAQCQTFVNNLATNLGVTTDALGAAVKKSLIQQIDAAQAAGKLTAAQAQAAKDRVNAANNADLCASLGVGHGMAGGKGGIGGGQLAGILQGDLLNAAATYFGTTPDALRQELASKGTLQAVAAGYGKDNDAGKAGLLAALEGALRSSLTSQGASTDQVDQAVNMLKQGFDRLYTAPIGKLGQGGGRSLPGGGPGQRFPHPGATPSAAPSASPRTN
jgi:hypothetical protein